MSNRANHNRPNRETDSVERLCRTPASSTASDIDTLQFSRESIRRVRHIYVHIPFCARICPYCSFYKDLLDRSQTSRFCEALLRELIARDRWAGRLLPSTIYFGGGTPTALSIAQLEQLLRGFHEALDLSQLV